MQWTGQKLMFDLRRDIFRHMQRMHIGFFDTHAVGRLVTRITSDVDAINEMFTAGVLAIVDDFLQPRHHGRPHAHHQLAAGPAGLFRPAADPHRHAPLPRPRPRQLSAASAPPSPASTASPRSTSPG